MDVNEYQRADMELKFLRDLEDEISSIIYKKFLRSDSD